MPLPSKNLLKRLTQARWNVVRKTYGNCHSTLIGLLVDWWISMSPEKHWVLEAGPTNKYIKKGERGQCDALLCYGDDPIGVLEVEGTKPEKTAMKIGRFFNAKVADFNSLRFGILLVYAYQPEGKKPNRKFLNPVTRKTLDAVSRVSRKHPSKAFIVIRCDKQYQYINEGIRSWNEYYRGVVSKIEGLLFVAGEKKESLTYYP